MLTGVAELDLRDLDAHAARRRCVVLPTIPDGAKVLVLVGATAPGYEVASLLAEHAARLRMEIVGAAWQVPAWLTALSDPDSQVLV